MMANCILEECAKCMHIVPNRDVAYPVRRGTPRLVINFGRVDRTHGCLIYEDKRTGKAGLDALIAVGMGAVVHLGPRQKPGHRIAKADDLNPACRYLSPLESLQCLRFDLVRFSLVLWCGGQIGVPRVFLSLVLEPVMPIAAPLS